MLKWISLALVALLALLQYHLWQGEGGLMELHRVRARADLLEADNHQLDARNDRLAAEVVDLKNGLDAIEERARNDLGMVRGDEQFIWVPSSTVAATPAAQDAAPESSNNASEG